MSGTVNEWQWHCMKWGKIRKLLSCGYNKEDYFSSVAFQFAPSAKSSTGNSPVLLPSWTRLPASSTAPMTCARRVPQKSSYFSYYGLRPRSRRLQSTSWSRSVLMLLAIWSVWSNPECDLVCLVWSSSQSGPAHDLARLVSSSSWFGQSGLVQLTIWFVWSRPECIEN